ncbi:alpha/beta hydrolase [Microbacterium sp. CFBP9034]|uniref:alpha/beta fold hydrolase n=1 Tax=Microbacterium sp. CFBP9034 TaxID=3096540 RepID=UPI002A69C15A|nr:alpha/beta hydrolase [Microbacterium sp. CFBP9034]MDY0910458.1 alpha/beta hydrolase [Microbacterium sp. CFBP9034]
MAVSPTTNPLHRNNVTVTGDPDGPVMVFAHGFGCSKASWDLVAPHFERDHRVVLFDLVGAGESDPEAYDRGKYDSLDGYADDILEMLDALGADDVIFVGHSVSAMIGVLAANRDPSRFSRLILIGPSPRYINDGSYRGGFEPDDIAALLDTLDANYLGWSGAMAPVIMGNADRPELGDRLTTSFCSIDPEIARHFAHVTFLSDNRRDLAAVTVPTLVMQSSADAIAPTEVGYFVHAAIPGSRLIILNTTGHVPILSGPEEVVSEMRAYLS